MSTLKRIMETFANPSTVADGSLHVGATVLDQLGAIVRERGVGRAAVAFDSTAHTATQLATLALGEIQTVPVEIDPHGRTDAQVQLLLEALHRLGGGAVVSIGGARTIAMGKQVAASANNGNLSALIPGPLPRSPIPHVAVPTETWPPEESKDDIAIEAGSDALHWAARLRDARLLPVAVIDGRLYSDPGSVASSTRNRAVAISVCAARDPRRPFEDRARALAAVHMMGPSRAHALVPALELRAALSLAALSHKDYEECRVCGAGEVLPDLLLSSAAPTPVDACLKRALA